MFIIDFDDTIFDTYRFKNDRQKALRDLGVSARLYAETYQAARLDEQGRFVYDDIGHASILSEHGFATADILKALHTINERVADYIFPDAADFLVSIKKTGHRLLLLSLGENEFQRQVKINPLSIISLFDQVVITNEPKVYVIKELLKDVEDDKIFFINDKPNEAREIDRFFPHFRQILKIAVGCPVEEYEKINLPHFHTLTEIKNYVRECLE